MANFEWYRSFVAIYRLGSVSAAANERFLTQPAVSQQLQALENQVGSALFTRTPKKMVPTEVGKQLYIQVVQSVDSLELLTQSIQSRHG